MNTVLNAGLNTGLTTTWGFQRGVFNVEIPRRKNNDKTTHSLDLPFRKGRICTESYMKRSLIALAKTNGSKIASNNLAYKS